MERTFAISAPKRVFFSVVVAAMEVTPVLIQLFITKSVMQLREVIVIPFQMSQCLFIRIQFRSSSVDV